MLELWELLKDRRYWCFWKSLTCHRGPSVILRERVHCSVLCMRLIVLGLVYPRKKADQKALCHASRMRRSNTLKIKTKIVKISRRSKFTIFYIFSETKVYIRSDRKRMASIINRVEDSSLLRRSHLPLMFMVHEKNISLSGSFMKKIENELMRNRRKTFWKALYSNAFLIKLRVYTFFIALNPNFAFRILLLVPLYCFSSFLCIP